MLANHGRALSREGRKGSLGGVPAGPLESGKTTKGREWNPEELEEAKVLLGVPQTPPQGMVLNSLSQLFKGVEHNFQTPS